jgi:Cu/Ag efflux protein CusF
MRLHSVLFTAALLAFGVAARHAPADAQPTGAVDETSVTTARARITAVDVKHRKVTLRGAAGNVFTVVAGPEVRNFAQIKVGDQVVLRYMQSVAYVISKPGTKLPDVAVVDSGVRAAPGSKPAGAVGQKVVITGMIVGVDPVGHVLSVVDQHGGPVRNFAVTNPDRQADLTSLKVGEMISVVFTEAVAVAVLPAHGL